METCFTDFAPDKEFNHDDFTNIFNLLGTVMDEAKWMEKLSKAGDNPDFAMDSDEWKEQGQKARDLTKLEDKNGEINAVISQLEEVAKGAPE